MYYERYELRPVKLTCDENEPRINSVDSSVLSSVRSETKGDTKDKRVVYSHIEIQNPFFCQA